MYVCMYVCTYSIVVACADLPGVELRVTRASSFDRAMKTPSWRWASITTFAPPFIPPPRLRGHHIHTLFYNFCHIYMLVVNMHYSYRSIYQTIYECMYVRLSAYPPPRPPPRPPRPGGPLPPPRPPRPPNIEKKNHLKLINIWQLKHTCTLIYIYNIRIDFFERLVEST